MLQIINTDPYFLKLFGNEAGLQFFEMQCDHFMPGHKMWM